MLIFTSLSAQIEGDVVYICGGAHSNENCFASVQQEEDANYVSNYNRHGVPFNNQYNPNVRSHPNFS